MVFSPARYCLDPGVPVHGRRLPVSATFVYSSTLRFACQKDRVMVGLPTTQCVEIGHQSSLTVGWSNDLPTCDGKVF